MSGSGGPPAPPTGNVTCTCVRIRTLLAFTFSLARSLFHFLFLLSLSLSLPLSLLCASECHVLCCLQMDGWIDVCFWLFVLRLCLRQRDTVIGGRGTPFGSRSLYSFVCK